MIQTEPVRQKRYVFGPFILELGPWRLTKDGTEIPLRRKSFEILLCLVERSGQLIEKEELLTLIWADRTVEESNLTQHIYQLRRALGDDHRNPEYILTVPGKGYLFNHRAELIPGQPWGSTEIPLLEKTPLPGNENVSALLPLPKWLQKWWKWVAIGGGGIFLIALFPLVRLFFLSAAPSSTLTSVVTPLITLQGMNTQPCFSPDGQFIAFSSEGDGGQSRSIYLLHLESREIVQLTKSGRNDVQPTWSPDGSQVAFLREPERSGDPYHAMTISAQGDSEREVGRVWGGLAWSPDGRYLTVATESISGPQSRLSLLPVEGGPIRRLGQSLSAEEKKQDFFESTPRYSRNGKFLAFVRWKSNIASDLYVLTLSSGVRRQLTFDQAAIIAVEWGANSEEIFFSSNRLGIRRIWRVGLKGGALAASDELPFECDYLTIHPSGKMIAFTQSQNDSVIEIAPLTNTPSPDPPKGTCLINSSRVDDSARFSPDGEWVVFHSNRSGHQELWLARTDCSDLRQLTQLRSRGLGSPRWSPDGTRIVFDHHIDQNSEIFTISRDGRELRRLTNHPLPDMVPSWSSDGAWVYFCSSRSGEQQIWKVSSRGGNPTQVTTQLGFESMESADGKTLYFTTTDTLWTKDLTTGIESPIPELKEISVDRHWYLTQNAIYFAPITSNNRSQLHRFNLRTRKLTVLFPLKNTHVRWLPRFAISPGEDLIATYYYDYRMGDIMLMRELSR